MNRTFVGRLVWNSRLHSDSESRTRTDHVRRKILPAMVHHDRLRYECRPAVDMFLRSPVWGLRSDQHVAWHPVKRPGRFLIVAGSELLGYRLVQHVCDVL